MTIYRLQFTHAINGGSEDCVLYFEAENDSAAVTEANNNLLPSSATNEKLYNIGAEVSLG